MNYAALLAVLGVLAFGFPVLVRFAARNGFSQGWALAAAVCGAVLVLAWAYVRDRVQHRRVAQARLERLQHQIEAAPQDPAAYWVQGEHLGDVLLALGRRTEARAAFEADLQLPRRGERGERARAAVERRVSKLRTSSN